MKALVVIATAAVLSFNAFTNGWGAEKVVLKEETSNKTFFYNSENWPDPFMPFIRATESRQKEKPPEEPLTGMRRFEPGQLNLVGVVDAGGRYLAMVEDSTGKGYTVFQGMKIGRYGTITSIYADSLVITQKVPDPLGNIRTTMITMELPSNREK